MATDPWAIDNAAGLPSYSGQELRLATVVPHFAGAGASLSVYSGVRLSGSGTDLLVQAQASPNMTVKVNTGCFVAQGAISSTQGAYTWALDTLTNLTISASHATLDRTDLIAVRVRDANVDTSGQRDGSVVVITGTAGSGTPALPTDASYFTIAQISVVHAVTSITSAAITDKRTFCAALGGLLPFVSTARPTSVMDGQPGWETDTSLLYRYRSALTKWLRDTTWVYKTADQGTGSNNTTLANVNDLSWPLDANSNYLFTSWINFTATTAGDLKMAWTLPAGATIDWSTYAPPSGSTTFTDIFQSITNSTGPLTLGGATGTQQVARLAGHITTAGTAGTAQLQFAQNVNDAASAVIAKNSWFLYKQVS